MALSPSISSGAANQVCSEGAIFLEFTANFPEVITKVNEDNSKKNPE